jgi:hypothetical protein
MGGMISSRYGLDSVGHYENLRHEKCLLTSKCELQFNLDDAIFSGRGGA